MPMGRKHGPGRRTNEQRREARQVKKNFTQSRKAERMVEAKYKRMGWNLRKTREGCDYFANKPGYKERAIEVKSGPHAHIREPQKRLMRKYKRRYIIERPYKW